MVKQCRVWVLCVLATIAGATAATAAPIVSGDGELWSSDMSAICGAPGTCGGTTIDVTPHAAWFNEALTSPLASWVSYAPTGVGDTQLAPFSGSAANPLGQNRIMWIDEAFDAQVGSAVNVRFWADDTLDIYLNGVLLMPANFAQATCAAGPIGCQPGEHWDLIQTLTQQHNVIRIVAYQVGTGQNNVMNPFGILYSGTYTPPVPVPEPASLLLLGAGLLGVAGWQRRRMGR